MHFVFWNLQHLISLIWRCDCWHSVPAGMGDKISCNALTSILLLFEKGWWQWAWRNVSFDHWPPTTPTHSAPPHHFPLHPSALHRTKKIRFANMCAICWPHALSEFSHVQSTNLCYLIKVSLGNMGTPSWHFRAERSIGHLGIFGVHFRQQVALHYRRTHITGVLGGARTTQMEVKNRGLNMSLTLQTMTKFLFLHVLKVESTINYCKTDKSICTDLLKWIV